MNQLGSILARLAQTVLQLVAGLGGAYLTLLAGGTFLRRRATTGSGVRPKFAIVIPAHNEEHTISGVLKSLETTNYPDELYGVFVVADNCSDATAEVAGGFGCEVWERVDPERQAKGHALGWAFERVPEEYDAVVILDADSVVGPGLLSGFARAFDPSTPSQGLYLIGLDSGADPGAAPGASYVASALHNSLKPLGRENLGCSAGVLGNGVCLPRSILREVPWQRFGLAEDVEYHLDLVLAGKRVKFVPEARVEAGAPNTFEGLQSQRLRWERGRTDTLRHFAPRLVNHTLRERSLRSLEALLSITAPPFSLTVSTSTACMLLGLARRSTGGVLIGGFGILSAVGATLRALRLVEAPAETYSNLFALPFFVIWRTYITFKSFFRGAGQGWVRTERSGERG